MTGPLPAPSRFPLAAALALVLYLPGVFLGYGADLDSYGVVETGRAWIATGTYEPSRHPGYLVHEVATAVLDRLGGSVLANLGTVAMALVAVACFGGLARHYRLRFGGLLTVGLVLQPVFWAAASCTIDYVWALALILGGVRLLTLRRFALGGVVLGLAIGTRLTSAIAVAVLLIAFLVTERDARPRVLVGAVLAGLLGAVAYVPAWLASGRTFAFLAPSLGGPEHWTAALRAGRFLYKNLYFWGLPAAAVLAVFAVSAARAARHRPPETSARPLILLSLAAIALYEILFLVYPIEIEYLLPILPFVLFLLGALGSRRIVAALVIAVASYAVVSINIARPDRPDYATGAKTGVWIERGYLWNDWAQRLRFRHCRTVEDWYTVSGDSHRPPTEERP